MEGKDPEDEDKKQKAVPTWQGQATATAKKWEAIMRQVYAKEFAAVEEAEQRLRDCRALGEVYTLHASCLRRWKNFTADLQYGEELKAFEERMTNTVSSMNLEEVRVFRETVQQITKPKVVCLARTEWTGRMLGPFPEYAIPAQPLTDLYVVEYSYMLREFIVVATTRQVSPKQVVKFIGSLGVTNVNLI